MKPIIFLVAFALTLGLLMTNNSSAEPKSVKVAAAQILCIDGDRSGNFARIENALIKAKEKGADIVAFPESCILGWENPDAHQRAFPIPGEDSERLCKLAKKYKLHINIGLDEKDGDKLYDSAILIDDNGKILLKHRKVDVLPELMTPPYTAGQRVVSYADTKFGRIGVIICADSFHEDLLLKLKEFKPKFVLIPYGWAAGESKWPAHRKDLQNTVGYVAKLTDCTVVGTDLVGQMSHGPWKNYTYGGSSVSVTKDGEVLYVATDRDVDVSIVTIKLP